MSLLEVSRLCKSYDGRPVVNELSFTLEPGEILGLLGPNGAGKSTTMMILCGLLTADSGQILLNGRDFNPRDRTQRALLGVVPQDLAIYPDLTARENLAFFGGLYGLCGQQLEQRIRLALEQTGLEEHARQLVRNYSGGMKRRLNFGVSLLHQPKLLILDEPTVGVDPQSRSHLLDCVRRLNAEGLAVIYATHYMEEVEAICHRVAIMDQGKMLAYDTLPALLSRVKSELRLRVAQTSEALAEKLKGLAELRPTEDGETIVTLAGAETKSLGLNEALSRVLAILKAARIEVRGIDSHQPNLEELFLELTGYRLRDDAPGGPK